MNTITKIMAVIMFICVTIVVISINLYLKEKETTKVLITASLNPATEQKPKILYRTKTVYRDKASVPPEITGNNEENLKTMYDYYEAKIADMEGQVMEVTNEVYMDGGKTSIPAKVTEKQVTKNNFVSVGLDINSDLSIQYNKRLFGGVFIGGKVNLINPDRCGILTSVIF